MTLIEAVFRHGVFEPLEPVNLREDQRVHLNIEKARDPSPEEWLTKIQAMQAVILQRNGLLPDSTPEIAADRMR